MREFSRATTKSVRHFRLLAIAPLGQLSDGESSFEGTATTYDARTHVQFFRDTLSFYKQDLEEWCVCFISDKASVNRKIARICDIPTVVCLSHKLHLDFCAMIASAVDMKERI